MSDHFSDRLIEAIARKGSPICVGMDPMYEMLPDEIAGPANKRRANDLESCVDAIWTFTMKVLEVIAPIVPIVKFQSAYFEKYLAPGVEIYYELIHEAQQMGLLVIGDVKRGDIGSTSAAYAAAHLDELMFTELDEACTPDAITINPMLGMDAIEPFMKLSRETGKGLFVLVRTSNPGSADFQDVLLQDGRTWSEALADKLQVEAIKMIGEAGWSDLGAVVGATQTHTMQSMRKRLPNSIFLLPGYGTQGATAEMTRAAFVDGKGAIVSASRSVLYPTGSANWIDRVRLAVEKMRGELSKAIE